MRRLSPILFLGSLVLVLHSLVGPANAFPPAPGFTFHGVARDSYGFMIKTESEATVVFRRGIEIVAQAPINHRSRFGENFRAMLPLDLEQNDPYSKEAAASDQTVSITVRFASGTELPVSSLTVSQLTVGEPAGMTFLDFTLGVDSDGDGLPDDWEYWQLEASEIAYDDPRYSLDTLGAGDFDGDGISDFKEYVAGTFALLNGDHLKLVLDGIDAEGFAKLRASVVRGKTYRLECSTDLREWQPAEIISENASPDPTGTFTGARTGETPLDTPATTEPSPSSRRYFRLIAN